MSRAKHSNINPEKFAKSYQEIANEMGLSREIVRRIEQRALNKIRLKMLARRIRSGDL